MEPATLAAASVVALAPYLAEAGKGLTTKAGEAAWHGCTELWGLLKAKLTRPEQQAALNELEAQPGDADVQAAARVQIRKAAASDPELLRAMAEMLKSMPSAGGQSSSIVNSDNAVSNHADRGSTITFNR